MDYLKYTETKDIPLYLCDRFRELPITMLARLMIDVSSSQTQAISDKKIDEYLKENNLSWIIIQYEIETNRLPKAGEKITIETYAVGYNRLFCYRRFDVYDDEGLKIATALITFAWINTVKRKMARLNPDILEVYGAPMEDKIRRRPAPTALDEASSTTTLFDVQYSDIDINNHVNNTIYIKWAIDSLGIDFLNQNLPTYLNIKYDKEVLENQKVTVLTSTQSVNDSILSSHLIKTENQKNSQIEMRWKKRD